MIQNILILTDFSHDAYNALFYATQLYKDQKCTFHILHAYDNQSHFKVEFRTSGTTKKLQEFLSDRTAECLRETCHKIVGDTEKNTLHQFISVPKNDYLVSAVQDYLYHTIIDLIAMGTKGRTGAADIFFGGNTMKIVKSDLDCPILCIPKQLDFQPISQMGYFTTFKHSSEKFSLSIVNSLAKRYEASLHIVHINYRQKINSVSEENKTYLTNYFENVCIRFHELISKTSKSKTIDSFVKARDLNLIIVCYYAHNFFYKLFNEPLVSDLSITNEIPMLILNDAKIKFRK